MRWNPLFLLVLFAFTSCQRIAVKEPVSQYYLSPTGSDQNDGTSPDSPWLTVNHPLNCGDVIQAAPSAAYASFSFILDWGTVTCPAGNNVAWLKCAVFDSCKIAAAAPGMWINQSYWGVQGWEVNTIYGNFSPCFYASPSSATSPTIHHIVFANDIANGCWGSGFAIANQGPAGVDYLAVVGSIVYDAVQGGSACFSGTNISAPVASDSQPGTHIFVAQVFGWANVDPDPCNSGAPTDGEGIVLDTLDAESYAQQIAVEDNISFFNGSSGIRVGASTEAQIYIQNNTVYGNNGDHHLGSGECGEIVSQGSDNVTITNNLLATNSANGCGGGADYLLFVQAPFAGNVVSSNFGFSAAANNTGQSGGFVFAASNIFGQDPGFPDPPTTNPGPPNCARFSSVTACMATLIASLTPTNAAAVNYGYRPPNLVRTSDPLFPRWLCNVNLPAGLVTMGCE